MLALSSRNNAFEKINLAPLFYASGSWRMRRGPAVVAMIWTAIQIMFLLGRSTPLADMLRPSTSSAFCLSPRNMSYECLHMRGSPYELGTRSCGSYSPRLCAQRFVLRCDFPFSTYANPQQSVNSFICTQVHRVLRSSRPALHPPHKISQALVHLHVLLAPLTGQGACHVFAPLTGQGDLYASGDADMLRHQRTAIAPIPPCHVSPAPLTFQGGGSGKLWHINFATSESSTSCTCELSGALTLLEGVHTACTMRHRHLGSTSALSLCQRGQSTKLRHRHHQDEDVWGTFLFKDFIKVCDQGGWAL